MAVDKRDRVVAVGISMAPGGDDDLVVWRLLPDGTLDPNFGGGQGWITHDGDPNFPQSFEEVHDVAFDRDGRIIVVGASDGFSNSRDLFVWQFE